MEEGRIVQIKKELKEPSSRPSGIINILGVFRFYFFFHSVFQRSLLWMCPPAGGPWQFYTEQCFSLDIFLKRVRSANPARVKEGKKEQKRISLEQRDDNII